jgi:hypothetical protein
LVLSQLCCRCSASWRGRHILWSWLSWVRSIHWVMSEHGVNGRSLRVADGRRGAVQDVTLWVMRVMRVRLVRVVWLVIRGLGVYDAGVEVRMLSVVGV